LIFCKNFIKNTLQHQPNFFRLQIANKMNKKEFFMATKKAAPAKSTAKKAAPAKKPAAKTAAKKK
jgi:hypothetical protein